MGLRKIDTDNIDPGPKKKGKTIKGEGKGVIFRLPVIAFAAFKNSDSDMRFEPIVVYGNRIDELNITGDLFSIFPAQSGIFAALGVFDAISDEEILLGYYIPAISSPDWNDVLKQTSYEIEELEYPDGETAHGMIFGFPDIEAIKEKSIKKEKNKQIITL